MELKVCSIILISFSQVAGVILSPASSQNVLLKSPPILGLRQELEHTETVDEKDSYQSESNIECYENGICTPYLHLDYKTCLCHQVYNPVVKKKVIRACSKNVVGIIENSSFLTDGNLLQHHGDLSKDDLRVWHNRGFSSI